MGQKIIDPLRDILIRNQIWLIPVFIYLIATLVIIISGYLYYRENEQLTYNNASSQLETLSRNKTEEIVKWFDERSKDVSFYKNNDVFIQEVQAFIKDPKKDKHNLSHWLEQTQKSHDYDIFIIDKQSNIYYIIGNDSTDLASIVLKSCMNSVDSGKEIFMDIYRRENTGKLFYSSMAPLVFPGSTEPDGCLIFIASVNEHLINEIMTDNVYSQNAIYSIVRNEGDSVYFVNSSRFDELPELASNDTNNLDMAPFVNAAKGREGIFRGIGYNDREILAYVKRIPGSQWMMVVHMDVEQLETPLANRKWLILGYAILVISIFVMWHLRFVQKERNKNLKEQLRLNNELINNREILQTIIQSSPLPLIVISKENEIKIWNKASTEVFGWTFTEVIKFGNPIFDSIENEELKTIREHLSADFESYIFDTQRKIKNGRVIDLRCWVSNVHNPLEKEISYLFIFEDITERKLIEKEIINLNESLEQRVNERTIEVAELNKSLTARANQLELLNAELESFTYSVSHDLKAPLRSIQGFTDIIIQDHTDELSEEVVRLFKVVQKNARRMDQLIRDLLDLSKVTRANLKLKVLDMNEIINDVLTNDFSNLDHEKVKITIPKLLTVAADHVMIQQVWYNLISNAIKYSQKEETSIIQINSQNNGDFVMYSVQDNGVGFNLEYINKLFNLFQRLHSSDQFEGTGVGLAIVKRIILRHGGEVWAEGEEGKGATFFFTLPVSAVVEE